MSISEKYAMVNGKNLNVYTRDQFFDNQEEILNREDTGIEYQSGDTTYVLPIRTDIPIAEKPGAYCNPNNPFMFISKPISEEEQQRYSPEHIVDFGNAKTIQDVVSMTDALNKDMNMFLETDPEDGGAFKPRFNENDSPEMKCLKQSIIEKHIDVDKYAERFGPNWANDKRKLNSNNITMYLLKRMVENFDLQMDLVISDKSSNVPNAMNKTVTVNIIPGNDSVPIVEEVKKKES